MSKLGMHKNGYARMISFGVLPQFRPPFLECCHRRLMDTANVMGIASGAEDTTSLDNLRSLCMQHRLKEAVQAAEQLYAEERSLSKDSFNVLLQESCKSRDLMVGRQVLSLMVKCQQEDSASLGYHLILLFSFCGRVDEACKLFNMILHPNKHTFHAILCACAWASDSRKIFELFHRFLEKGVQPHQLVFLRMLNCCDKLREIETGKLIHDQIVRFGLQKRLILGNSLIYMYSKCRYLDEAFKVFDTMPLRDVVSWGSLIGGLAQHGYFTRAFEMYNKMQIKGVNPSNVTFLCILKHCNCRSVIEEGRWVHTEIMKTGFEQDKRICSALVGMYSKCQHVEEARQVFESLPNPDVVAWGAMIMVYTQNGPTTSALDMLNSLKRKRLKPDITCFSSALNACGKLGALQQGKILHCEILERGLEHITVVGGALVDMYTHCGSLEDARYVFEGCQSKDDVFYGAMISGYVQNGQDIAALRAYAEMEKHLTSPSKFVLSCIFKACGSLGALTEGRHTHDQTIKAALDTDVVVGSTIVDMYAKCSSIMEAYKVFRNLRQKDLVTWGTMIVGHVHGGQSHQAYALFKEMLEEGSKPDTYVFTGILKACGMMGVLKEGRYVHFQISEARCELDTAVGNALVDMYAKCRSIDDSMWLFRKLPFRNMEGWGAIIAGCTHFGLGLDALDLFSRMLHELFEPDTNIFSLVFKACGSTGVESEGRVAHSFVVEKGCVSEVSLGNSLVDMYCKYGRLEDARYVFDELEFPECSSWCSMVTGYCLYDQWIPALELFNHMCESNHKPSKTVMLSLLKACANVGAVKQGTLIHAMILRDSHESDTLLGSTLLEMYANFGCMNEAKKVFDSLPDQDVVSWGALIAGHALHGNVEMAGECFNHIRSAELQPTDLTFTNLLTACSHTGFVEGATFYFRSMIDDYGMLPDIEQYSCIIDIFGQMGSLGVADDMLQTMAKTPDFVMCTSLLNSCQRHGNLGLGRLCFKQLVKLIPSDASAYTVISNLCADLKSWDNSEIISWPDCLSENAWELHWD